MSETMRAVRAFYGVMFEGQSYLNLGYLLLAFPLGIFYFVFLVTCLSVGVATAILWIGLAILLVTGGAWLLLANFERWLAAVMLRESVRGHAAGDMPGSGQPPAGGETTSPGQWATFPRGRGPWAAIKARLGDDMTWTSLLYLLSKFPLGVASFCALVTLLAVSAALTLAPWAYVFHDLDVGWWRVDSWSGAWLVSAFGMLVAFPVTLHVMNLLARVSGWWARQLLYRRSAAGAA